MTNTFIKNFLGNMKLEKEFQNKQLESLENDVTFWTPIIGQEWKDMEQKELIKIINEGGKHKKRNLSELSVPVLYLMADRLTDFGLKQEKKNTFQWIMVFLFFFLICESFFF